MSTDSTIRSNKSLKDLDKSLRLFEPKTWVQIPAGASLFYAWFPTNILKKFPKMSTMKQEQKIDVHNSVKRFNQTIERFELDETISKGNRELIILFLNDCKLGKTVRNRQKKLIKERRLYKYLYHLKFVARCINKDFDKLVMSDMEKFIKDLQDNTLRIETENGDFKEIKYSEETKRDIKVALRKFYKWLWGNCERHPEIVSWFDTSNPEKDVDALDEKEVEKLVSFAPGVMEKALVWSLYESGARPEEFLNIRIRHVTEKDTYFTFRIEYSKTFKRTAPIYEEPYRARGISYLKEWLTIYERNNIPSAQVFPIGYRTFCNLVKELGRRALNKSISPKFLRDSRATFLARKKVGRYQMCKLMGWSMSSQMPDRYIDRAGVSEEEAIEAIRRDDFSKASEENLELKRKLLEIEKKYQEMERISEARGKADDMMTRLVMDQEVQKVLIRKIKELGLTGEILEA